ncbi:hypothetical protein K461DRAFT_263612 [Myriangium duriaei CBS 260.36]|uniref:BRCT domain-containing protein n=1 Tax=Myriangium duriaei CBS 260.36 TaxID=1168546 RepID=A0A9P4J740_9PEZI|nr:hypothetical protein K461DRAFT_263612 [Myriangium duriaei CBS 260.36]
MPSTKIYALFRTDYLDPSDSEGRDVLISLHATPVSAKSHLEAHIKQHSAHLGLSNPNTKASTYPDELFGTLVIVGQDDYHSFDIRVHEEELHGGTVTANTGAEDAKAATNGAAKGKGKKGPTPVEDTAVDAGEVDVSSPPSGPSTALKGKKILVTGTLEGVTRAGVQGLVEDHGGEFVKDLRHEPDLVVIGVRAGPKKVDEIKEKGLETVDQAGFYRMIKEGRGKGKQRGGNGEGEKEGAKKKRKG